MVQPGSFIHPFWFNPSDFGRLTLYVYGHDKLVLKPDGRDIAVYKRRYMLFDGQLDKVMYKNIMYFSKAKYSH